MRAYVIQGRELIPPERLADEHWEAVDEAVRQFPELKVYHRSAVADSLRMVFEKWANIEEGQ